jgi:cell filamentation protein
VVKHPWDVGALDQNWAGYFIPGTSVLRNRVGAIDADGLRDAETDLSEYRLLELREHPNLVAPRTYDMAHLTAIHRQLFQDVYEWAGDLRTVGLEKGGESFCPPDDIWRPLHHVAIEIVDSDSLRSVPRATLQHKVAYLYDQVNYAHPFREGNGRTTREFSDQLLAEQGLGLNWADTDSDELHAACHQARGSSDIGGLITLFNRIIDANPAYDF